MSNDTRSQPLIMMDSITMKDWIQLLLGLVLVMTVASLMIALMANVGNKLWGLMF